MLVVIKMMYYQKGVYTVRRPTKTDIKYVAQNMRRSDAIEVRMSDGMEPEEALQVSVNASDEAYAIRRCDIPLAIFGISKNKIKPDMASIWLLGTNELADHKKAFHLITKHYLKYFMVKTPILFNFVMEANSISIEWLEKLGAKFSIAKEYGKFGALFKYFELRGD